MSVYVEGQSLAVTFTRASVISKDNGALPALSQDVTFDVVKLIEPFTCSAVMCVRINTQTDKSESLQASGLDPEATYILKLYDRRCVPRGRKLAYAYDSDLEAEYQEWLGKPDRASITYDCWLPDLGENDYPEGEDRAVVEDWHQYRCSQGFADETEIYSRLQEDKSKDGLHPQFFGTVQLATPIGPVCGIVLEYISPALTLIEFLYRVGSCGYMSSLVDEVRKNAMSTLARVNDDFILNRDIGIVDVLVQLSKSRGSAWPANGVYSENLEVSRCVLIDFADARPRYPDETDFEWRCAKNSMDEDGVLHHQMKEALYRAREDHCRYHGEVCRNREAEEADKEADRNFVLKAIRTRQMTPEIEQRFPLNLTPDQVRISEAFYNYGLYEYRPHPQTVEEARSRQEAMSLAHKLKREKRKQRFPVNSADGVVIYEIAGIGVIGRGPIHMPPTESEAGGS